MSIGPKVGSMRESKSQLLERLHGLRWYHIALSKFERIIKALVIQFYTYFGGRSQVEGIEWESFDLNKFEPETAHRFVDIH
jgi:hypothetical protein